MALAEFRGIQQINGPFVLVEAVPGVGYGDLVDVVVPDGTLRRGRVVSLTEKAVLI